MGSVCVWVKFLSLLIRNLQALVKGITLRRTKSSKVAGKQVVELPDKKVFVEHVTLSEEERREYDLAKIEGRNVIGRCALDPYICGLFGVEWGVGRGKG